MKREADDAKAAMDGLARDKVNFPGLCLNLISYHKNVDYNTQKKPLHVKMQNMFHIIVTL